MMYPYMMLEDETLVTHSHLKEQNGIKTVDVHFERPIFEGFDMARISLPSYEWIMRDGYSDEEIKEFEDYAARHAHNFYYYAEIGGIPIAKAV